MTHQNVILRWFSFFVLLSVSAMAWAQAPLTIDNLTTDRATLSAATWFRVPSAAGYGYTVLLDGKMMPTDMSNYVGQVDYHELFVSRTDLSTLAVTNRLIRFIVQSDRGNPELGLIKWTPYPPINSTAAEVAGAQLHVVTPSQYPLGLHIPVIAWLDDGNGRERRANGVVTAPGYEANGIRLLRGIGSGFLPAATNAGTLSYEAQLHTLQAPKTIQIEAGTPWTPTAGIINSATSWPANSRIHITNSMGIGASGSLTIGEGTVVRLDYLATITNYGQILINGTLSNPVVFTATNRVAPERNAGAWGGFLLKGTGQLIANGAIFAGGGGGLNYTNELGPHHRAEQPVILLKAGTRACLTNCYIIETPGQVGNGRDADLTMDHCLAQRAITCGEYEGGTIIINHSAIIEFPAVDGVYNATIADADYDGIYFTLGTHILKDSLFGFAKDDAIDSGSGSAGTVLVTNCWVESALHEAHAWSGGGRVASSYDSVLINCGQGLECGWSQEGGTSPICLADRMLSTGNSVGTRFGDNYAWDYWGYLQPTNSLFIYNYRDVWGMNWKNWRYGINTRDGTNAMNIQGNFLSQLNTNHPNNTLWDPARDGWRLAHWMTTPLEAPVGIGFAVWTNQFAMTSIYEGVPVRLSSFTTNFVSVSYTFFDSGDNPQGTGTLTFAPGETVKRIYFPGFQSPGQSLVRVILHDAIGGELTGETSVSYQGTSPGTQVALTATASQLPGYRLLEGPFLILRFPTADAVSVDYRYETGGNTLASGTVRFQAGETLKQVPLTGASPFDYSQVQLTVSNAVGATLFGTTRVTYTNAPVIARLALSTSQVNLDTFSNGLPVGLSGPAPTGASVDFAVEDAGSVLTNGTLAFAGGSMGAVLTAPSLDLGQYDLLRVTLSNPVRAQLGAPSTVYLVRTVVAPPPVPVTLLARGAQWRYLDTGANLGSGWVVPGYNDGSWGSGGAPLGYDGGQVTTVSYGPDANNKYITTYFRSYFTLSNAASLVSLDFRLLRDDGAAVYLNGGEVYRENLPGGALSYTNRAVNTVSGTATTYNLTTKTTNQLVQPLVEGTNVLAVEIHQANPTSSDILFDLEVVGNPAPPPPPPQQLYWASFESEQWTLAWSDPNFRLQRSDKVTGPWTNAPVSSPVFINPTNSQQFFRLRAP